MKRILSMILWWACLAAGAQAQTFAQLAFTHMQQYVATPTGNVVLQDEDLNLVYRLDHDGSLVAGFELGFGNLQLEQPVITVLDYTLTLSIRGLSYPFPVSDYCTPIAFVSTCVNPYGNELAFVQVLAGYVDPRTANPFLDYITSDVKRLLGGPEPARTVESGQLSAGIVTHSELETSGTSGVTIFLALFASPIPEPATGVLMAVGLVLLAGWRGRAGIR